MEAMRDRRADPRYLVKEEAFVWELHCLKAGYHSVTILNASRNGMRLESAADLPKGSSIAVDFRGMIVCGTVQYCKPTDNGFVMGVQIKDVLDPLREESTYRPASQGASATAAIWA